MADSAFFSYRAQFPCSRKELYAWHARPGALERLIPPWEKTSVISREGSINPGGKVTMRMHAGPIPFTWKAHHLENTQDNMFRDIQEKGPFAHWSHTHLFEDDADGSVLHDKIEYTLPFHAAIPNALQRHIKRTLQRTFQHRRKVLTADLRLHQQFEQKSLKVLISGASGVLGRALKPLLTTGNHEVWSLVRRQPNRDKKELFWDPIAGEIDDLPYFDAVIHLAGEYIGVGRWTEEKKRRVVESRTKGTTLLARKIAAQPKPPEVFLCASAIGYYGDTKEEIIDENAPSGNDFISKVCRVWEEAAQPAKDAGIRTVLMRIGISLSPGGGALQRLLSTAPLGYIRRFGSGEQYVSWISIDDTISAIYHAMRCEDLHGPVNISAPQPVSNINFMRTLADITGVPLLLPVPAALLKGIYGQMATEILLSGCNASCKKLIDSGFIFRHATLAEALRDLLGKFKLEEV